MGLTHKISIVLVVTVFILTTCQTEETEFYPDRWYQIDIKAAIDNERLFKKYKDCFMSDVTVGCPKVGLEVKAKIPEIIETMCSKCKPEHVEAGRLAINYTCTIRRQDFDELKNYLDPNGSALKRAEEKYGKLTCLP